MILEFNIQESASIKSFTVKIKRQHKTLKKSNN